MVIYVRSIVNQMKKEMESLSKSVPESSNVEAPITKSMRLLWTHPLTHSPSVPSLCSSCGVCRLCEVFGARG